jgi:HEAT repeat protein
MSTNPVEQILEHLVNEDEQPSTQVLAGLSDLNQSDLEIVRQTWKKIPLLSRRSLIDNLGKIADDDIMLSYEAINRFAIEDADHEVRSTAIRNLWESEDHHLIPNLIHALTSDESPDVRAAAAKALGPFILLGESDRFPRKMLELAENALISSFRKEDQQAIISNCLQSLGYSSNDQIRELILEAYNSEVEALIEASIIAMGRSANSQYAEYVLPHLISPSPGLRYEAVVAAGEMEIQEAVSELFDLLGDVNPRISRASIWSLSQIGGKRAKEILQELLESIEDEEDILFIDDALSNLEFMDEARDLLRFSLYDSQDMSD